MLTAGREYPWIWAQEEGQYELGADESRLSRMARSSEEMH